jgi:thioesterase domain-containing protein
MLDLWQRTLGVTGLGIDDEYFAVGGTSLKTVELFSEVSRCFRVELPLTTILNAPTVRKLCRHIEARSEVSGIVELRASREASKNLFLVHDGDGEVLLYSNLAKRLSKQIAVLGISPRTTEGIPLAHTRIEDMAGYYIDRVKAAQPRGPFIIGGMCAGGVIAYEMARQLIEAGETVDWIFLLDAATPQAAKQFGRVTKERFRRFGQVFVNPPEGSLSSFKRLHMQLSAAIGKIRNTVVWELADRIRRLSVQFRFHLLEVILRCGLRWPAAVPSLKVRQIYECAEARYLPGSNLDAKVALLRATMGEGGDTPYRQIYASDTFGWGLIHADLSVKDVSGGHFSMLQEPYVEDLSKTIEQVMLADQFHGRMRAKRAVSA